MMSRDKRICSFVVVSAFLFISTTANFLLAQESANYYTVQEEIKKAVYYLQLAQIKETNGTDFFKGEWPSYIYNTQNILFLGKKGKNGYDSNCFTTASVHNLLAEYHQRNPQFPAIDTMLEMAIDNIRLFKKNETYNFWHYLERAPYLQKRKHRKNVDHYKQHRANRFYYKSGFVNRYANIFNDADDTSIGYLAELLNYNLFSKSNTSKKEIPREIGHYFSSYRDVKNRGNRSLYNYFRGYKKPTGAYLTWFGKERRFNPLLWLFPYKHKQNIIFGANDVDCVVNANIIYVLHKFNEFSTPGVEESISFINNTLQTENYQTCGIYYPTEFNLHYAVSKSIEIGNLSFNESIPFMLRHITGSQNSDGSFSSAIENNEMQATLFATLTLLNIGNFEKYETRGVVDKGIAYLRKNIFNEGDVSYFPGGVFFSGGTVVRNNHIWRSDAYTTALAIEALDKYSELIK